MHPVTDTALELPTIAIEAPYMRVRRGKFVSNRNPIAHGSSLSGVMVDRIKIEIMTAPAVGLVIEGHEILFGNGKSRS